jgi:anti-anti-sigma regulatory factor
MESLSFQPPTPPELTWRIDALPDGARVAFTGEIDENADFGELVERLRGSLIFDLGSVSRINSCGVREWVSFLRELGEAGVGDVTFVACSPAIVNQMNMIYNFRGPAKVRSFLAPYVCTRCHTEEEKLLEVATFLPVRHRQAPEFSCPRCDAPMELDDLPERYFSFLGDT